MAVKTTNSYGKISINDSAIAAIAGNTAMECYGVVDMISKKLTDYVSGFFKKRPNAKGVRIATTHDRIFIDLFVVLKYGVSITAVADSLRSSVKYRVEKFTGMIVDTINVNVVGVQL